MGCKNKNGKPMLFSKIAVCGSKKTRFIKEQKASGLLLGPNSPFKEVPLLVAILYLYWMKS